MKYDQAMMTKMAENLENYLDIIDNYVIIEGLSKEDYDQAVKTVKKLIKKLKKGKGDEVFDRERYIDLLESGHLNDM
jgi:hypothetical protein